MAQDTASAAPAVETKKAPQAVITKPINTTKTISSKPKPSKSTTIYSINPLVVILGAAAIGSIFSATKDFVFAHPVSTTVGVLVVGLMTALIIKAVQKARNLEGIKKEDAVEREKVDIAIRRLFNAVSYTHLTLPTNREV